MYYNHTAQQFGGLNLHKIYDFEEMNQTKTYIGTNIHAYMHTVWVAGFVFCPKGHWSDGHSYCFAL